MTHPSVPNTHHERDQSLLPVFLYGLFQCLSSQRQLLISGQKSDLHQRDQACLLDGGMGLYKNIDIKPVA